MGADLGEDGLVELADAIGVVRQQLVTAQLAGRQVVAGQVLRFGVGKVVVEFSGELKTTVGGSGGVTFWVATANGKAERTGGATHKVSVELLPQTVDGTTFVVNDDLDAPPPN